LNWGGGFAWSAALTIDVLHRWIVTPDDPMVDAGATAK
jgi:hypothetical protein